jgi:hypothetical protein
MTMMSPFGTTILEAPGVGYRLSPASMRIRLGVSPTSCNPVRWLVANEGCAAVSRDRNGTAVLVSAKTLLDRAYDALSEHLKPLRDEAPQPLAIKFYENHDWRSVHVETVDAALQAITDARSRANQMPAGSYVVAEPVQESQVKMADDRLYAFVQMHRLLKGRLQPNLMSWLVNSGLMDHVIMCTYDANQRSHMVRHIGRSFSYNGASWPNDAIEHPIQEKVDPVFGKFTIDSLRAVEALRQPMMTGVDLAISNSDRKIVRASYVRVLLPFEAPHNPRNALILGASSWTFRNAAGAAA